MILKKRLPPISLLVAIFVIGTYSFQLRVPNASQPATVLVTPEKHPSTENEIIIAADDSQENSNTPAIQTNKPDQSVPTSDFSSSTITSEETKNYTPVRSPYVQEYVSGDVVYSDNGNTYPVRTYTTQSLPNDPAVDQWWVQSATLPNLWDVTTGSTDTLLAIIDTGFALNHEEFNGRWHQNTGETGLTTLEAPSKYNCSDRSLMINQSCNLIDDNFDGIVDNEVAPATEENPSQLNCSDQSRPVDKSCNMIDDDNNGLVDDWRGWDFMSFDNSVQAGAINPNGSGTRHGSYVTGLAAANANNNVGIAGVNWNTKVLPIQALGDDGSGTSISVARGIRYAVSEGADVISMSLGGSFPDAFTRQAIKEAIKAGVIVVAASGNDGCDCMSYPANYPEVVAVGALNQSNNRASFSSYGANLDILAPGTNLYTATWSQANQTSGYASGISGTSLATPIVSGLLTSLIGAYPDLAPSEIIAIMTENTNRLSLASNEPWSATIGHGTLDGYKAVQRPLLPQTPAIRYDFASISRGDRLQLSTAFEPIAPMSLHACGEGQFGSTKIYRLFNQTDEFYSASEIEMYHAVTAGYSRVFFSFACIGLLVDQPVIVRSLNIHGEFSRFMKL